MNRRSFLSAMIASGLTAAIDPEELLWKPTKTIFIPPPLRALPSMIIYGITYDLAQLRVRIRAVRDDGVLWMENDINMDGTIDIPELGHAAWKREPLVYS